MLPTILVSGTRTHLLLHLHAHRFKIKPHLLKHIDGDALPQLDQTKQQMLGPDIVVVEAVSFLAGKSQDLLRARCEVIHHFPAIPRVLL